MIGKAYATARHHIGKALNLGSHYLDQARRIGKSLTPFYHSSGLSKIPFIKELVDTTKMALGDYDKLKLMLGNMKM